MSNENLVSSNQSPLIKHMLNSLKVGSHVLEAGSIAQKLNCPRPFDPTSNKSSLVTDHVSHKTGHLSRTEVEPETSHEPEVDVTAIQV